MAFDLPTQLGYNADDDLSIGEVGRVGVSISSLDDMRLLFQEIPLDRVSTSMTINAPAAVLWAMYIAVAKEQGVGPGKLRGTIQNDILKEYVARGTYIFPPRPSMRLITDTFRYGAAEAPKWNPISISGYHIREAGSSAVQEVAFTLANGIAYVQAALAAGWTSTTLRRDSRSSSTPTTTSWGGRQVRAARRMWARIMHERFGAQRWSLAAALPYADRRFDANGAAAVNNIVRVALQPWRRCWAARSRCTPIRWMKRFGCRLRRVCAWLCERRDHCARVGRRGCGRSSGCSYHIEA